MEQTPPIIIVSPPKKKKPFYRRLIKRLLIVFAVAFGLLFLSSIIIAAFFEKEIGDKLLAELNKQLDTELTVEEFDLSLLSGFPNVSADLKGVVLEDAMGGNLLEAKNISFRLGLFSLLSSNIKVKSVVISDGALFIKRNRKGKVNYLVTKKPEKTEDAAEVNEDNFGISLAEASLDNVELIYIDERDKQEMKFLVDEAVLSGEFSTKKFSLTSFAEIKSEFVELEEGRYLVGKDIVYDATLNVDFENGVYEFIDVDLGLDANMFKVDGSIKSKGPATNYDLVITGKDGSLESVLDLLPEEQLAYFGDFTSKGTFLFSATVKGKNTAKENPSIRAKFGLRNGSISSKKLGNTLKDVTFTARFTNGKSNNGLTSVFELSDFKGYFNRELIETKLRLTNFNEPKIEFDLDGVLPLASIYGLFDTPYITDGDGEIEIKELHIEGRYKDMLSPSRIKRVKTSGILEFDDAELQFKKENLVLDKGQVKLIDNSLIVKDITFEGAGSNIELNGKFLNLIPVLFADEKNSKRAELLYEAKLHAENLDIDRLLELGQLQVDKKQVRKGVYDSLRVAQTQKQERFTKFLNGNFSATIDNYNYREIQGEAFSGSLTFKNNQLAIKGDTRAMEGRFQIDGTAYFEDKPHVNAKVSCEEINIREFFRQCENFGQEVLQSKQIKGKLEAKMLIDAFWDEEGSYQNKDLRVRGDISIRNGELVNMRMLYDFADYIKIKDLRHIKFNNMRNWFEIRKERVYLPAMFIQSNALNLTVSGEHSFNNEIDYRFKINAGQVLWNKLRKYNPNKKPQAAKKKGWFNLYYRIYGTVEDYEMKNDKTSVKRRFRLSEGRKKEIQRALIRAFGENEINTTNEPSDWNDEDDIPEYPEGDEGDEFLDFDVEGEANSSDEFMWEEEEEGSEK